MSEPVEVNPYNSIAALYDRWNTRVVEDIGFYTEEAVRAGGPVLELGVGTGRIAVPIAQAGVSVIGVDSSAPMLERCRARAREAGVAELIDLRLGDLRDPPVVEKVPLAISPVRAFLHLLSNEERLLTLARIRELLGPGGRLVFDVFSPSGEDIAATHGRWIEREPEIFERADWDATERRLTLRVRAPDGVTSMDLAWLTQPEWNQLLEQSGFSVEACYVWFDRSPYNGAADMVFLASGR
ncbi:MAG: class I SAM-dependent methyltransferase [Gaiellaceae bacterium]